MNCTQVRDSLPLLLYGDLKPDEADAIHKHLGGCQGCQGEYAALQRLRQALDRLPAPAVEVQLPRVYAGAARLQEKRLRRWRRVALLSLAVAAVVLLALLLNLEVRWDAQQVVLRWGAPPPVPALAAQPQPPIAPAREGPAAPITAEEIRLVKELIHALADDAESRDQQQRQTVLALHTRLEEIRRQMQQRSVALEHDVHALYTAYFGPKEKGN
jgi:anti-sigma factor RsiW